MIHVSHPGVRSPTHGEKKRCVDGNAEHQNALKVFEH